MSDREDRLGEDEGGPKRLGRLPPSSARHAAPDERLAGERAAQERELSEDRELTEDERLELFRDSLQQSVLPDLPAFPGYHTFWATTTNPRDSISRRIMLGYKLIRVEECPGWDGVGIKAAGVDGVVAVNEMVGMRVPLSLYNRYMREVHHYMPLSEEEKLRSQIDAQKDSARRQGTRLMEGDGTESLVQRAEPMPNFAA